jgi:hypothetical protein
MKDYNMAGAIEEQPSDRYLLKNSVRIINEETSVIMFTVTISRIERCTNKESEILLTAKRFIPVLFNILYEGVTTYIKEAIHRILKQIYFCMEVILMRLNTGPVCIKYPFYIGYRRLLG